MLSLIPVILQMVMPAVAKVLPDATKQAELQAELTRALMDAEAARFDTIKDIVVAETQAGGLNALWRPLLALFYLFLMAWAWVLVPVVNAAFKIQIWTPDPGTIGTVAGIFCTVYGLGRSLEKGVSFNGTR